MLNNVELSLGEQDRHVALHALLRGLGLDFFSTDAAPTWRNRRLDHVLCNSFVVRLCRRVGDLETCPWARVDVRRDLQHALSVDHALLLHELLLLYPLSSHGHHHHNRRLRRRAFLDRPCKMRVTDPALLQQQVISFVDSATLREPPDPQTFLQGCAARCSQRPLSWFPRSSSALPWSKPLCWPTPSPPPFLVHSSCPTGGAPALEKRPGGACFLWWLGCPSFAVSQVSCVGWFAGPTLDWTYWLPCSSCLPCSWPLCQPLRRSWLCLGGPQRPTGHWAWIYWRWSASCRSPAQNRKNHWDLED